MNSLYILKYQQVFLILYICIPYTDITCISGFMENYGETL